MEELEVLRKKIKEIDRQMIGLIHRRIETTKQIGKRKKALGIPLRDWSVERSVLENGSKAARKLGIEQGFIKSIINQLIEQSRIQQERLHFSAYTGSRESILVIGGLGAMGQWFSYFFQNQGHRVFVYDPKGMARDFESFSDLESALRDSSCALISTPLSTIPEVIDRISDLSYPGMVFDIASVKCHLGPSLRRAASRGIRITSVHPMFGPACRTLSDKIICFCDCGVREATDRVKNFFRDTTAKLVELTIDEHDRLSSYVLGLSHFINLLFLNTLSKSGCSERNLKKIASTTFNSQLLTAAGVINENPELYFEIQALNPYQKDLFDSMKKNLDVLIRIIGSGRRDSFFKIFLAGKEWLNEHED
jgi:chorismate mutase/prephenate dehydrogenase